jgi:hypothetical protein
MSKKRSAKGQFVSKRAPKATRVASPPRKRRRRNPDAGAALVSSGPTANPPPIQDLVEFILPGFAGYGATKMLARIVATQAAKKFPNAGKHIAAASTIAAFAAAWLLLHRIKRLQKYHTPAVVGAGIASLQTLIQTYLKKYAWMISDVTPDQLPAAAGRSLLTSPAATGRSVETHFPGGPEIVDDGEEEEDVLVTAGLGSLGGGGGDEEDLLSGMN